MANKSNYYPRTLRLQSWEVQGLSAYNIDQDINKKNVVLGTADNNSKLFVRNISIQRAKMNLASGKNVTAYLDASDLTNLENSTVIG
ncbi:hypothetical protein, partial [Haemophilus parainfluenzae]|uniref:hypothetical protein n=1 Tax=Haemophilus parainfluenzae TaxID=729 RepID=UPI00195CBA15